MQLKASEMISTRKDRAVTIFSLILFLSVRIAGADLPSNASEEHDSTTLPSYEDDYEYNLPQFLNTTERIWIYQIKLIPLLTSSTVIRWCQAYNTINITSNETYFSRSYIDNHRRNRTEIFHGNFKHEYPQESYDAMDFGSPGATPLQHHEEMIYQGLNNTCAIIMVTWRKNELIHFSFAKRDIAYELRVTQSTLENPARDCLKEFNDTARSHTSFSPYSPDCLTGLHNLPHT
uniref:Putative group i salivary lipocalin n=1 Tax=Rhipicephalus pulchellus TaxID=72859 RepID=L7LQV5_RHIPC